MEFIVSSMEEVQTAHSRSGRPKDNYILIFCPKDALGRWKLGLKITKETLYFLHAE